VLGGDVRPVDLLVHSATDDDAPLRLESGNGAPA